MLLFINIRVWSIKYIYTIHILIRLKYTFNNVRLRLLHMIMEIQLHITQIIYNYIHNFYKHCNIQFYMCKTG